MPELTNPLIRKIIDDISTEPPSGELADEIVLTLVSFKPWNLKSWFSNPKYRAVGRKGTAFDIDYTKIPEFKPGSYIRVRMRIGKRVRDYVKFIETSPGSVPKNLALTAGNQLALEMLCGFKRLSGAEIEFCIKYRDPADGQRAAYNLGLLFYEKGGDHAIPVIYDPTVPNDGS